MYRRPDKRDGIRTITASEHETLRDYLREVARCRDLLAVLLLRDLKVRYKQTVAGYAWAIFQPIIQLSLLSFVFGFIAKVPSSNLPYPLFLFAALLPWQYVSRIITEGSVCMTANSHLITKIYFPRLILILVIASGAAVDFAVGFALLATMLTVFDIGLSWRTLALPLLFAYSAFIGVTIATWLSSLDVSFRDVKYLLPVGLQVLMFVSPIVYSPSAIPESIRWWYYLNPLAVMAEGYRWSLLGLNFDPPATAAVTSLIIFLMFFLYGLKFFRAQEGLFADRI